MSDRLEELREEATAAAGRVHQVRAEQQAVKAEAEALREQVTEAFASGEDNKATKLQARRLKAEQAAAGPWVERVAGSERALARAQAERDGFVATNYFGLVQERAPAAHRAARRIEDALRALVEARTEWHAEEREQLALTRAVGHLDGRSIPGLGEADELAKVAQRLIGAVPVPLPSTTRVVEGSERLVPDREAA